MFGYGTDFGRLDFDQTRRKRPSRLGFNGCGFAAAQWIRLCISMRESMNQCGFAAAHCGKALHFNARVNEPMRLRRRPVR